MAYFIYNVHPARDKEKYQDDRYRQSGPACWYYAAKMLLRFHDKLQPQMEMQYAQWQALHVIRKFLGERDFDRSKLNELKGDLQRRISVTEKEKAKGGELRQWEQKLLHYAPEALQLVDNYQNLSSMDSLESMRRYGLFRAAFGTELFEPLPLAAYPATSEGLEQALMTHGPLYCGGGVSADVWDDFEVPREAASVAEVGLRAKTFAEERHAIALIGINTDAQEPTVYYRDPNQMNVLCAMPATQLFRQADPFKDGKGNDCLYLAVRCGGSAAASSSSAASSPAAASPSAAASSTPAAASSSAASSSSSATPSGCTHLKSTMVELWENEF